MALSSAPWRSRIVGHGEVAPADLVPNPENWRSHPQEQRDALGGALEDVGWVMEVIVNQTTGNLVDGHLRLDLALSRGEPFVPVTYVELTHDEERLVLATLDPLAAMADAEVIPLQELLAQLDPHNAALRGMLGDLGDQYSTRRPGLVDPDDAPGLVEETDIKRGDVFALGDHRLACGDATMFDDVDVLLAGEQIDLVWTDPPYGVNYVGKTEQALTIQNDALSPMATRSLIRDALRLCPLRAGGVFYIAAPLGPTSLAFLEALEDVAWTLHQTIVWVKDRFVLGRSDFHYQHEGLLTGVIGEGEADLIAYGWTDGAAHLFTGNRRQSTVWDIPRPSASREHPTMKPIELVARSIEFSSHSGDRVYDPFAGSGSTIISAEQTRRRCYAMEIDPRYVAVAIKRWETFTGQVAVRQDD